VAALRRVDSQQGQQASLQTDVCTHAASFATGTITSFQEVKRPGREAESSPAPSADVKDE
jgi:hypothetical protein